VFSAVGAECRGWYRKLISEVHYHLKDLGAEHVYLSTQEQNASVLRTWEKLGYHYAKTERILRAILTPA
jgi:ribosomal protein S18 acetylase RimI-like enzyme